MANDSSACTDMTRSVDRDPTTEVGDIDHLISLRPIQPRGNVFKGTDVLVSRRIKRLYTFRKLGTKDDCG